MSSAFLIKYIYIVIFNNLQKLLFPYFFSFSFSLLLYVCIYIVYEFKEEKKFNMIILNTTLLIHINNILRTPIELVNYFNNIVL